MTASTRHPTAKWSWGFGTMWSWLTFSWVAKTIAAGYKRPLELPDFYPVPPTYESKRMADRLYSHCDTIIRDIDHDNIDIHGPTADASKSKQVQHTQASKDAITGNRLARALFKTFAAALTATTLILFVEAVVQIVEVYSMGRIVLFLQSSYGSTSNSTTSDSTTTSSGSNDTLQAAYGFAGLLSFCSVLHGILHQHGFLGGHRLGFSMRTATVSLLYRKTLMLSKQSMARVTTGHITNLISTDVERFVYAAPFFAFFIVSPLHALASTILIWGIIGPFALCGMALIFLAIPLQMYISKFTGRLRSMSAAQTDKRVKITSELLSGMRVIKMYAWEQAFAKVIQAIRAVEIRYIEKSGYIKGINLSLFFCFSAIITLATFIPYQLSGEVVTAYKVFTCFAYYNYVKLNMALFLPNAIHSWSEMKVSLRRIEQFIALPEHHNTNLPVVASSLVTASSKPSAVSSTSSSTAETNVDQTVTALLQHARIQQAADGANSMPTSSQRSISVHDITCEWLEGSAIVKGVSFNVQPNEILCIAGPVGSGKSTVLMALLKELKPRLGSVHVHGSMSYASQEPWVLSMSIRDNIVFGEPFDAAWYQEVIAACALDVDLQLLPAGDATEVGERGVTLSGGQRARLSLARAVYANRDIVILDDPLSAVDTRVGKHIFQKCLNGVLSNKIRVLVTHQVQYLPYADKVLLLGRDGCSVGFGTYNELLAQDLLKGSGLDNHAAESEISDVIDGSDKQDSSQIALKSAAVAVKSADGKSEADKPVSGALIKAEERQRGVVKRETYMTYWLSDRSTRTKTIVAVLFGLMALTQVASVVSDWFLSFWVQLDIEDRNDDVQPLIYSMLVVAFVSLGFYRAILFFQTSMRSSKYLHNSMFEAVLSTPIIFFDTNPVGRILNRFSKDLGMIDDYLVMTNFDGLQSAFSIVGVVFFVSIANPWIFLFTVPLLIVFILLRQYYLPAGRDIKRIEAAERSPIFSHLSSTLVGIPTIRCHDASARFIQQMDDHLDVHGKTYYMFMTANRWLGLRLDMLSAAFVIVVVFFAIGLRSSLSPGLAALSLSYTLQLTGAFQWMVRQSAEVESLMVSVERALEYAKLEPEQTKEQAAASLVPKNWPASGSFEFRNVCMRYSKDAKPSLNGISFVIGDKEKIGVVGRTGAGKSSLLYVLFRLSQHIEGDVLIDGVPTSQLELTFLRSKISVIPQDPTLFSGTLRYNLDPFDKHSDFEIWQVLEDVQLKTVIENLPGKLSGAVSEGGGNFSVGQRQLICLARAALRKNRILVLDEATANVDNETDAMIQAAIRRNSADCTVFTIAHRLHTVMDSDRILVLDAGRVVEFDTPLALLQNPASYLSKLVGETNLSLQLHLRDIARSQMLSKYYISANV